MNIKQLYLILYEKVSQGTPYDFKVFSNLFVIKSII